MRDPDYLIEQRKHLRSQGLRLDYIGLGMLAPAVSCWEVLLSKGQEWDWFGDPFGRVQIFAACFVFGIVAFIVREWRTQDPLIDLRILRDRNLRVASIVLFCAFAVLYGASIALPAMLQQLLGYDAYNAGLVLSPGRFTAILTLLMVGFLISRGVDARWLIVVGLLIIAFSNFWMSYLNLEVAPWNIIAPRLVLTTGLGFIFAPINVAALLYVPKHLRGSAIAMISVLRNEGGSVGTSMSQTIVQRRDQFHSVRLNDALDPLNSHLSSYLAAAQDFHFQTTGNLAAAHEMALQNLADLRHQQSLSLAYFDIYWLAAILAVGLVPLILLMKRSVAEKGTTTVAE